MKNLIILPLLILSASCFGRQDFHYKRRLAPVEKEGWYNLILPVDVFQHVNSNYSDLRLLQITEKDSTEIPYLLKIKNDDVSEGFLNLEVLNKSTRDGKLYLTFKLNKGLEVNYLDLSFEEDNYNGYVKLEGSNDQKEWFELVNHQRILSMQNNMINFQFATLNFPLTNYHYLRAAISTDKPLTFKSASFRTRKIKEGSFYTTAPKLVTSLLKKEKQTVIEMNLPVIQPVSKASIQIQAQGDYYRAFSLEMLRDSAQAPNQTWTYYFEPLISGYLTSIEPNQFQFEPVNSKKLRLIIYNEDNAPLKVQSITIAGPYIELTSQLKPGANYLFYGNENLTPPTYDLIHFTNQIPDTVKIISADIEEKLFVDQPKASPLLENKLWLWGAMALIIGLLGFATLKMISKK